VRTRLVLAPVAALLALSACSGTSDKQTPQSLDATTSPSASDAAASTTGGASAKPTTTASTTATSQATAATTTQAPASTTSTAPLSTKAPGKVAAQKATAAGSYTYDSTGKVTIGATPQDASGTQTLTIGALKGGIQHSTLHSDDSGDTEQDLVVRDTGTYGASLKLTSPAFTKEFRPAVPVLLMPDPASVGKSWSWKADSTDGATHVVATNKLVRVETLTIGGQKIATVVLQTHLVLSGDVKYDAQVTLNWAPAYRLPVKQRQVGSGMYSGIPFKSDVTGVMRSVKPA
jgi:hypothetical protein